MTTLGLYELDGKPSLSHCPNPGKVMTVLSYFAGALGALVLLNLNGCTEEPALAGLDSADATADREDSGSHMDSAIPPADTGIVDSSTEASPSPFGLDSRPSNKTCLAKSRPAESAAIKLAQVFGNYSFSNPISLLQSPGDNKYFYLAQKNGVVLRFDPAKDTVPSTFLDVSDLVQSGPNEAGLLGVAFSPGYETDRRVYLYFTQPGGSTGLQSVVYRYRSLDNGNSLDRSTADLIIGPVDQPYQNHNGGALAFGLDGFLYLGLGDGGSGGDPNGNGQSTETLLGKILRVDVSAQGPYSIPADNPFAQGGGRKEIFAWGFRNPWRFSFDRKTGELWVGDVGQNTYEEVDRVQLGKNYGWNTKEGFHCFKPAQNCNSDGLVDPIVEYDHSQGVSITGGYVYRGSAIPALNGVYVYGDFGSGRIWGLFYDNQGKAAPKELLPGGPNPNISSFGESSNGELYVLDYVAGKVFRIEAGDNSPAETFPQTLSASGCVNPNNVNQVAEGLIPYDVISPLWSDGAQKERFLAIPDSTTIAIQADGDFDLPLGSVLLKTFLLAGKRIETRLFMRHSDGGWGGYSYEWNDTQTDALLVQGSKTKKIGTQDWLYPSRAQCLQCHTEAAGRSLGLEVLQMNRNMIYPNGRISNQLTTLDHVGIFSSPLSAPPYSMPKLATPTEASSGGIEVRARSYLHANCAFCHRPNSNGGGPMDFRYTTTLKNTLACNAAPQNGNLGIENGRIIAPGKTSESLLSARMHTTQTGRMPPLASSVVDSFGVSVIDDWIDSLTTCP